MLWIDVAVLVGVLLTEEFSREVEKLAGIDSASTFECDRPLPAIEVIAVVGEPWGDVFLIEFGKDLVPFLLRFCEPHDGDGIPYVAVEFGFDGSIEVDSPGVELIYANTGFKVFARDRVDQSRCDSRAAALFLVDQCEGDVAMEELPCQAGASEPLAHNGPVGGAHFSLRDSLGSTQFGS